MYIRKLDQLFLIMLHACITMYKCKYFFKNSSLNATEYKNQRLYHISIDYYKSTASAWNELQILYFYNEPN